MSGAAGNVVWGTTRRAVHVKMQLLVASVSRGGAMSKEVETRSVALAEAKAGLEFRAGHPVVIVVSGVRGSRRTWAGRHDRAAPGDGAAKSADDSEAGAPEEFKHLLALKLVAIGGTPLARERVQVIDPDTGKAVGKPVETNEAGVLRAKVPEKKKYQVQILEDPPLEDQETPRAMLTPDRPMHIDALFLDARGAPLADQPVAVTSGGEQTDGRTDAEGWFHLAAAEGLTLLELRGQNFYAHPAPSGIANGGYRFVVAAGA